MILEEGTTLHTPEYADVPIFRGGSGADCEEFIRSIYAYAFRQGKSNDYNWIANYVGTRLSGKALRWFAPLEPAMKWDWTALQVAFLNHYPSLEDEDDEDPKMCV